MAKNWKQFNLIDLVVVSTKKVEDFDGEKEYIATGDIDGNKIISHQLVTFLNKPSRADLIFTEDDVLFAKMKSTVKVLLGKKDFENKIFSTGFYILTPQKKVSKRFLYFFLLSKGFNSQKDSYCKGATMSALANDGLKKIKLRLPITEDGDPDYFEQEKIASILEQVENLKNKRYEANQKIENLIPALFDDFFGDPSSNPKNYIVKNIGDVLNVLTDYHANGSYEILRDHVTLLDKKDFAIMVRTTNLERNNFIDDLKYISKDSYEFLKKSKLFGGEVIINKIGSAGNVYLMPQLKVPCSLAMNQFMLDFDSSEINNTFAFYYLKTKYGESQILSRVKGAVTKTITKDEIRSIPIFCPPPELQLKFLELVKEIEKQKEKQLQSTQMVDELFNAVMSKSFA